MQGTEELLVSGKQRRAQAKEARKKGDANAAAAIEEDVVDPNDLVILFTLYFICSSIVFLLSFCLIFRCFACMVIPVQDAIIKDGPAKRPRTAAPREAYSLRFPLPKVERWMVFLQA